MVKRLHGKIEKRTRHVTGMVYSSRIKHTVDNYRVAFITDDEFLKNLYKIDDEVFNTIYKPILTVMYAKDGEPFIFNGGEYDYQIIIPSSINLSNPTKMEAEIILHELGHVKDKDFQDLIHSTDVNLMIRQELKADKNIINKTMFIQLLEYVSKVFANDPYNPTVTAARIAALQNK